MLLARWLPTLFLLSKLRLLLAPGIKSAGRLARSNGDSFSILLERLIPQVACVWHLNIANLWVNSTMTPRTFKANGNQSYGHPGSAVMIHKQFRIYSCDIDGT